MTKHHDAPMFSGTLPNIYNQALTFDHLRQLPSFTALPPVESILTAGASSYRYVRQDDDLWSRLHVGRLTSGYLSAALGLFEPSAAKRLKLGKNKISHGPLLNAYRHLSQNPYHPTVNENITEESAAVHNARITLAFNNTNNTKNAASMDSGSSGGGGGSSKGRNLDNKQMDQDNGDSSSVNPNLNDSANMDTPNSTKKKRQRRKKKAITSPAAGAAAGGSADNSSNLFISEEVKLKKSRTTSSQGLDAVRCAWGTAQESTTLHVIGTGVFANSQIIEAGLFIMEESVLPKNWNFRPGELPPIGSSPDALAQHPPNSYNDDVSADGSGNRVFSEIKKEEPISLQATSLLSNLTLEDKLLTIPGVKCEERKSEKVVEVIEVKNTCPFDYSQQKHSGGKKRRKFVVCDRGPRNQLDVLWIPQLQLHMLCTQTSSALLVSRSATRGIRVFRVAVDVEFQRLMLCVLRKLYTEHVIPQKVPEKDVFERMPEHGEMLKRIRSGVNAAEVVVEISGAEAAATLATRNGDSNLFKIDSRFFLD